jgi:hypothetical protein
MLDQEFSPHWSTVFDLKVASGRHFFKNMHVKMIYRVAQKKKYSSLIQYNLKIKRAITLKQKAFSSVMSNLNFGICHVYSNIVLAEIFGFENKWTFSKLSKISKKRPIKLILTTSNATIRHLRGQFPDLRQLMSKRSDSCLGPLVLLTWRCTIFSLGLLEASNLECATWSTTKSF